MVHVQRLLAVPEESPRLALPTPCCPPSGRRGDTPQALLSPSSGRFHARTSSSTRRGCVAAPCIPHGAPWRPQLQERQTPAGGCAGSLRGWPPAARRGLRLENESLETRCVFLATAHPGALSLSADSPGPAQPPARVKLSVTERTCSVVAHAVTRSCQLPGARRKAELSGLRGRPRRAAGRWAAPTVC